MVKIGTYKHFSGHLYEVIAVGNRVAGERTNEVVLEEVVIYHAKFESEQYGKNHFWVRSVANFEEKVIIDGREVERFQLK